MVTPVLYQFGKKIRKHLTKSWGKFLTKDKPEEVQIPVVSKAGQRQAEVSVLEDIMNNDTDVIIIGAGVAGLAAAKSLAFAGISFVLVEASHRIGGRAYAEQFADGSWFDLGCSYLHEAEINPFVRIAAENGFALGDGRRFQAEETHFHEGSKSVADLRDYQAYIEACEAGMLAIARDLAVDGDRDMASAMDWDSHYAPVYSHLMAGLNGSDVTEQSVEDFLKSGFGLDVPVTQGLGRLVEQWGASVPVTLNCKVSAIDWHQGHVAVKTARGRITAKRVIVTVSTNILAAGLIRFAPDLPDEMMAAITHLRCGTLNKIGFCLAPDSFADDQAGWHVAWPVQSAHTKPEDIASFDINIDGKQQAIIFAGGSFGIHLEKQGPAAMRDYAEKCLATVFGNSITGRITDVITTAWHSEPLALGSYSHAEPGYSAAREHLCEAVADTIFFAGEAASVSHYGTCHGAYISGQQTVRRLVKSLA